MNKLKSILGVLLILSFVKINAQKAFYSPDLIFDSIYDSDGKKYFLDTLKINTTRLYPDGNTVQALCTFTNSYFNVYFEPGCGMELNNPTHNTRRNTICQLFQDISNFISNAGGVNNKVNIWVRDPNFVITSASSNPSPGKAVSFYSYPYALTKSGIVDNLMWQTIVSGQDPYKGITSPLITSTSFYHAIIAFNYANGSINWHDDLATVPTSTTSFDLYNVGLHEITHALGFETGINFNGASKITTGSNYYTRFDRFLKTQSNVPLINNSGGCSMYNYSFNTSTTAINPNVASCGGNPPSTGYSNNTNCGTAILYASPTQTVPVYTSDCYEPGVSLAHFEDMCYPPPPNPSNNDQYFVMAGQGPLKRYLKEEERKVLCNLGYSVAATYGTPTYSTTQKTYTAGVCNGIGVAGINDGLGAGGVYTYTTNVNVATGTIQPLSNDYGVSGGSYECVEVVIGTGTLSANFGNFSAPFNYTPTSGGLHLLRYIPVSSGGTRGNITYIYVKVLSSGTCSVSLPNSCEMVYNGAFEYGTVCGPELYGFPHSPPVASVDCWTLAGGSYKKLVRNCSVSSYNVPAQYTLPSNPSNYNIDTWSPSPNNSLLLFNPNALPNLNCIVGPLTNSLVNGAQYKVSYWALEKSTPGNFSPLLMNIVAAPNNVIGPVSGTSITPPAPFLTLCTHTLVRDGNWHYYTSTITYTGTPLSNVSFITTQAGPNTGGSGYAIDDLSILPASSASSFTLPPISCTGTTYTLNSMVSIPNGTFTGPGVTYSSPNYIFSASTAGTGLKTISYTYTTATGCTLTAYAQTEVFTQPTVSILPNPGSICPGTTSLTYTATGATTYTWASSNQTVIGNPATLSPTATTVYTVTGANGGCFNSVLQSVIVNTACICSFDPDISYLFPSSSLTITGASHSGAGLPRYSINNNITVTGGVGFYSAEFAIAPNVLITVASGGTLTINKCHLFACNNMWQGIVVQDGGYLIIESDALIEDAVEAVLINANTNTVGKILTVNTAIFNNNYKAISVTSYTQSLTNYPFEIVNSVFTGRQFTVSGMSWPTVATLKSTCSSTNNLASPYCLQNAPTVNLKAPNNTTSARIGINLNLVGRTQNETTTPIYNDITIGDYLTQGNFNIFDNLFFGIYGVDANVQCYNNIFQNTRYSGFKGNFTGGVAVSLNSSTLNINSRALLTPPSPYHLTRKNKFYDCTYSLLAVNYFEMKADYMEFRSQQTASGPYQQGKIGIYLVTNRFKKYDVINNLIYNIENGIIFNTTYGPIKFGASNYTNTQYAGPVNIWANSISPVSSGSITTEFVSNAITTQNILSAGSTQTVLAGALINENGNAITNAYKGIYASNFNNPKVISQSNFITLKANPSGGPQYGIKLVAGTSPTITLNNISGATGLATNILVTSIQTEQNNAPSVTCNTVSSTGQGFEFAKSQPNSIWKGNSMQNHIRGMVLNYTATIGQQGSTGNPIDNTWNGSWPFGTYNTWTDNGTFASNTNTLYVKNTGVYYPAINSGMPIPNSYQSCCIFTTTGTYYCGGGGGGGGGSMMMSSSNTNPNGDTQTLDKISEDNSDFIAQYQLYVYIKENPSIKYGSTKLNSFYTSNNNSTFGKLSDIEEELAKGNLASATGKINSLNAVNSIVNNYKSFFTIYLSYINNTINLNEISNLENLANKCPFTEGAVVYKARALYNVINKSFIAFTDNCPVESSENARFSSLLNSNYEQWQISLYPNPASEEINISSSQNEHLNLEIRDMIGKIVLKKIIFIENNLYQLKVDLKSGVYFVNLMNINGQHFAQKLIITR